MWPFSGNITGTVDSQSQNLPMVVEGFLLVNKTGGTIGVNVYKIGYAGQLVNLSPLNKQLAAGEVYESTREVVMLATDKIRVQASGSCDYDFAISNTQAPEI